MIDVHTHVLAGVDDGARSSAESVALASALAEDGVTTLAATPHVNARFPTTSAVIEAALAELRQALESHRIPVAVVSGAEVAFDSLEGFSASELRTLTLDGNGTLLVELPDAGWPRNVAGVLGELRDDGLRVLLAHPERNSEVQARPFILEPLVADGALVQVTAAAVDGTTTRAASETGRLLVTHGLAHAIATDAHGPVRGRGTMSSAGRATARPELARWLTRDAPQAMVEGRELPPRPDEARHGGEPDARRSSAILDHAGWSSRVRTLLRGKPDERSPT